MTEEPAPRPSYDVILVVYRSRSQLQGLLDLLPSEISIIVVDNSARKEHLDDLLEERGARHIDSGGNLGFSQAANLGARASTAPYILFLNPDTRPSANTLDELVGILDAHPEYAAVGAAGLESSGGGAEPTLIRLVAHSLGLHRLLPRSGIFFHPEEQERLEVDWIAGSCLAIRRDVFLDMGGFDSTYFIYMSDIDLGRRLRERGHRLLLCGDIVVPHEDGGSSDIPSVAVWQMRGRGWGKYLINTKRTIRGTLAAAILLAGYFLRCVIYGLAGRSVRRREMWHYIRSMLGGIRNPRATGPPESVGVQTDLA